MDWIDRVVAALGRYEFSFTNEVELQDGIAEALRCAEIPFIREARLSRRDRPDFMVGDLAVEVKVDGGLSEVTRQLYRYAELDVVGAILLVSSRLRLANLPKTMNGKPVRAIPLVGSAL